MGRFRRATKKNGIYLRARRITAGVQQHFRSDKTAMAGAKKKKEDTRDRGGTAPRLCLYCDSYVSQCAVWSRVCGQKYAPERIRFGSRSRREQRNLLRCARVFSRFSPVRRVQCEPRDRVARKQVYIDVPILVPAHRQRRYLYRSFFDVSVEIERQSMNQAPRATMPQSTHRTFATVIIVIMLVTGLVVAQKYTGYQGDPDSLVFPDSDDERWNRSPSTRIGRRSQLAKELQLAKEISTLNSMDEFLTLVKGVPKTPFLTGRMGENEERSNAERPTPARCMPELQPVSLKLETDPSTIYYPSCTRVKRCGGCCSHSLLSCQPTASIFRNFEVLVVSVDQSDGYNYRSKQIVPLEEHTTCMCDCRIKPEHCNNKQSYVQEECRCMCNNVDEQKKCIKNNDTKIWNPEQCTCFCREEQECSTGFYFDRNTCSCRQIRLPGTWFPPTKGADYRFEQAQKPDVPPVIIALDPADPRRKPKEDPEYK